MLARGRAAVGDQDGGAGDAHGELPGQQFLEAGELLRTLPEQEGQVHGQGGDRQKVQHHLAVPHAQRPTLGSQPLPERRILHAPSPFAVEAR